MKNRKWILICIVAVVLAGLWVWRYTTMNTYYDSFANIRNVVYQAGEVVPFGDDKLVSTDNAKGYSIRVNSMEILEPQEFVQETGISLYNLAIKPERIALVYITLFNEESDAEGIYLIDFELHGIDNYVGMNWALLAELNPVLQGAYGIRLEDHTQYELVLPFNVFEQYFDGYTWSNMDSYDWFLRITTWPNEKDIAVNAS